jgi:NDP-sugar pyrophosphorylase family protein
MKPTLLILAAGKGSRYGGLKQLDPVGPDGATIMDYSIYDAARAGFGKVVFVIRRDFAPQFEREIGARTARHLPVDYAYQELADVPAGFSVPADRQKPWGTGHAVRSARSVINEPFASINADDFYGRDAFERMARHLERGPDVALVGYRLRATLSDHGGVARGVCELDANGALRTVREYLTIERRGDGALDRASGRALTGDELVSMNFWGFAPSIFAVLDQAFANFMRAEGGRPEAEFLLPAVVDELVRRQAARVLVLPSDEAWFGVTYPADRAGVVAKLAELTAAGAYPRSLAT